MNLLNKGPSRMFFYSSGIPLQLKLSFALLPLPTGLNACFGTNLLSTYHPPLRRPGHAPRDALTFH
jgi:hypothetical protein